MLKPLLLFLLVTLRLVAQETQRQDLPRGWKEIVVGMSLEEAKKILEGNPDFRYRGDPDVSMLLQPNTNLIETEGSYFIRRAALQFREGKLYSLALDLNTDRIDYFSVFTALSSKYGDPDRLDPTGAFWQNEAILLSLEKPLTVKYQDRQVLEQLRQASGVKGTIQELTREQFLRQF